MNLMLETNSAEYEAAQERFYKLQDRTAKNFGYGATDEALHIAQGCFERLSEAFSVKMAEPVTPSKGWDEKVHRLLGTVSPHIVALAAINNALRGAMDELSLLSVCEATGRAINHELFANELRLHDEALKNKIKKWVSEKHGNLKYRLQAARSVAKKMGFSFVSDWKPAQLTAVGGFVMDILLDTLSDLFVKVPSGDHYRIEITEGAQASAQSAMKQFIRTNPIFLPTIQPPVPWTEWNKGGPVDPVAQKLGSLVRTRHRETVAAVKAAIKSGQMQPAMDALNAVQATPWKINAYIMNVVKECQRRGVVVGGLPQREDFPMPKMTMAWDDMNDDQKKLWRSKKEGIKRANRTLVSDRLRYDEDMETADVLAEHERFFIPHNLDWRGREYPMTNFNFQREDRVRALFLFADHSEPIGEEGIAWLKVHVANCGDFEKVSKKSYEERIKWVDENITQIKDCAMQDWDQSGPLSPSGLEFWTKADKPFLFLAACVELTKALSFGPGYVCSLPCSWDGSCSGLQHLCAMTRSEEGSYVNLTNLADPQDVYQTVADAAFAAIEVEASQGVPAAKQAVAYDGNRRKLVKRNVMTTPYGSKKFGMAQQHMDDLMEPLRLEVLQGKRSKHPFGDVWAEQHSAAQYLAGHVHRAIRKIVEKPAKAMDFLQGLAQALAHVGKPLEWTTPVGLPWSNRYHESKTERVSLWLHDAGVRIPYRPVVATGYQKDIDKKRAVNGVAPNFVHACDASHLLLTVLEAVREGIRHFALVHDSFGCPPSQAARFQGIIREVFVEMYEKHDVLAEVFKRAFDDLDEVNRERLPDMVDRGTLNIKEVLNAKYAFA
jgi:DNA-directed RNA polymerase